MISVSVKFFVFFMYCFSDFTELPLCVFLQLTEAFFKTTVLNFLLGRLQISIFGGSVTGKLLCSFGGAMFH